MLHTAGQAATSIRLAVAETEMCIMPAQHACKEAAVIGGVAPPITASFHSNVSIFTPLLLNNYHVRIAKLSGFGHGAAPRAQIR